MEEHYNISKEPDRRAMAGLSMGSRLTTYVMYQEPARFRYYCILSGGLPLQDIPVELYDREEIKDRKIFIGCGWYDQAFVRDMSSAYTLQETLAARKIPFLSHFVYSGHTWTTWRQSLVFLLDNFLWK
jgi:enterochelin esterase-like enzyme